MGWRIVDICTTHARGELESAVAPRASRYTDAGLLERVSKDGNRENGRSSIMFSRHGCYFFQEWACAWIGRLLAMGSGARCFWCAAGIPCSCESSVRRVHVISVQRRTHAGAMLQQLHVISPGDIAAVSTSRLFALLGLSSAGVQCFPQQCKRRREHRSWSRVAAATFLIDLRTPVNTVIVACLHGDSTRAWARRGRLARPPRSRHGRARRDGAAR